MPRGTKNCPLCGMGTGPKSYECPNPTCDHVYRERAVEKLMVASPPAIHAPAEVKPRSTYKAAIPRITCLTSDINLNPTGFFDHMLNRENQLARVIRAARTAVESGFRITNGVLIYGPPSSGKSSFFRCFKNMVGEQFVYEIDATASTQAGIINDLQTHSNIRFIILKEFDKLKGNGDEFKWLLSGMDEEKKIRKITSDGPIEVKTEALFLADCNNLSRIERIMDGALYSRFVNKIYFPPISDDDIHVALQRYNQMIHGDDTWIPPVIDYVRRKLGMVDMRTMIGLLTDGREGWLDGTYEQELEASSI